MGLFGLCLSNLAESAGLMDPGGGELQSGDGRAVPPAGPLGLDHLVHVRAQQAEHQRVDQHTDLGGLALSVGNHGADQGQLAGQGVGHGVGNQKEEDEASNLGHLVLYTLKKNSRNGERLYELAVSI